jgi:hypothetical protein
MKTAQRCWAIVGQVGNLRADCQSAQPGASSAGARRTLRIPNFPMNRLTVFLRRAAPVFFACAVLYGGDTRFWSQSEYADFEKGNVKKLSLRSDGLITLAPQLREMFDTSLAYLWALARDSKGVLYFGGGSNAKLYRVTSGGKGELVAELEGLAVQAIAIDAKDRVYAATSPDGKVYRIAGSAKPEVFFDPKTKYIWALAFDPAGNLYVATGDPGEIYRVTPDGKGALFFHADETHVRSMTLDAKGNLIVGTEPRGLVLRVSPAGEGLRALPDAEERSDSSGRGGRRLDLRGRGGRKIGAVRARALPPPPSVPPASATVAVVAPGVGPQAAPRPVAPPPATLNPAAGASGGTRRLPHSTPTATRNASGPTRSMWFTPSVSMPRAASFWAPATTATCTASKRRFSIPRC